ncbi:uncharacterized protein [Diadema setosum]|uniref:uncharacterized protein n=1 Tax=Diadema setosum TaxID=31175 RepID=UPI003B3A8BD8
MASPENKMEVDPKALLHELVLAWQHHVPFQTITSIATPHEDRHVPTMPEIKDDILKKMGGCCYQNNVGCYEILRALGFDVSLIACDIKNRNNHPVPIVNNISHPGSQHLVDVGTSGYPTFLPVPLDFDKESPEFHHSYLVYKFVREGDTIIRLHRADCDPAGAQRFGVKDGWYPFMVIHHKNPVEAAHFKVTMEKIYIKVLPSPPFLISPRVSAFPDGRFVCINNTTLLLESEEDPGKVQKTYLKSLDELLDTYARFFPQLPRQLVQTALADANVHLNFDKE